MKKTKKTDTAKTKQKKLLTSVEKVRRLSPTALDQASGGKPNCPVTRPPNC